MNKYTQIKQEYLAGELESIYAIEFLEKQGLTSKDAEALVET